MEIEPAIHELDKDDPRMQRNTLRVLPPLNHATSMEIWPAHGNQDEIACSRCGATTKKNEAGLCANCKFDNLLDRCAPTASP